MASRMRPECAGARLQDIQEPIDIGSGEDRLDDGSVIVVLDYRGLEITLETARVVGVGVFGEDGVGVGLLPREGAHVYGPGFEGAVEDAAAAVA